MIATLAMYDRPELRAETDALWAGIRDGLRGAGIAAPDGLTRDIDPWEAWQSPDLVFAQTCGLPYRARLSGRVALVGTPCHQGLEPGHYHSVIISRPGPLPDRPRLAVNDELSQSGWANLCAWIETKGIAAGPIALTGAHHASARAVHDRAADLAAIDAVSWDFMQRFDPWVQGLTVQETTPPLPALPYIAPLGADLPAYRRAVRDAIDALGPQARGALNLHGLTVLPDTAYTDLPPAPAIPLPPAPLQHSK